MNLKLHSKKLILIIIVFILGCFLLTGFNSEKQDEYQIDNLPPTTVQIIEAKTQPLTLSSQLPGRIEPFRVAEVRARVEGLILSRDFEEGALVKAGQVLFHIDPRLLEYTLSRAEAELARNKASLDELALRISRYQSLLKSKSISQQEYDTVLSSFKNTQASYQSARAD